MLPLLIILGIFGFMIFVFIGLNLSEGIENFVSYILFWVVYCMVVGTLFNTFLLGYFWSIIRKKTGPTGLKGVKGDMGEKGEYGKCDTNSSNAICLVEVSQLLDELYKKEEKTNEKTILKNGILINGYMNRKVATICKSIQFDILTEILVREGKNVGYLIDYIKGIFQEWFYLIYNENKDWFADPDGLQKYNWKRSNPFNEIKKYDIFYWGDTRRFKPLKNNVCTTDLASSSNVPAHNPSGIQVIQTNDYDEVYDDKGSKASVPMKVYRPKKYDYNGTTYYPLGDVIDIGLSESHRVKIGIKKDPFTIVGDLEFEGGSNNGPDKQTVLVAGNVVDPVSYSLMWRDQKYTNSYSDELRRGINAAGSGFMEASTGYGPGRIWKPNPPAGYVCLGDVVTNYYPPDHADRVEFLKYNKEINVKCIPESCIEQIKKSYALDNTRTVWSVNGSKKGVVFSGEVKVLGNVESESATPANAYNLFRADNMSYVDKTDKVIKVSGGNFYGIKNNCMKAKSEKVKEVESEFKEIGIGWYGRPANNIPKYSIFNFMGLIPEGMIEHNINKKKYYIVHYGGNEFNCYNILIFNNISGKYDRALESSEGTGSIGSLAVTVKELKKNNKRQQWKLMKYENFIYFQNIYNSNILHINGDLYETNGGLTDTAYFEFTPAFGVGPDIY
jgi:hypothetical protein